MDYYTVMLVVDAQSPVRRFQLSKARVRQVSLAVAVAFVAVGLAGWDYTRALADSAELDDLRVEVAEQREQIQRFSHTLRSAESELEKVKEFERKVRIIANLPGAAGIGGEGVTELVPQLQANDEGEVPLLPPAGVPVDLGPFSSTGSDRSSSSEAMPPELLERDALTTEAARHVSTLTGTAGEIATHAGAQGASLEGLLSELETKRRQLASMPSIWPTKGWLTSRFGPRVSPFTGRRQRHAGIDIAAKSGSEITSPARGRVSSIGSSGPLGNSVIIDHGFGVKTFYGHTETIHVSVGDEVRRGQLLASVGSSGRSTGPHLHYAVHVDGKARDPLDYIFD